MRMVYSGLSGFITRLETANELHRINIFINPVLEITEITDRVTKSEGKALLFENNGTDFPVLINAYGSTQRMSMAIGRNNLSEATAEIEDLFASLSSGNRTLVNKLSNIPAFLKLARLLPSRKRGKGVCQQVIHRIPDLGILPVLKCWPYDGGRFFTLPMVHTKHPETGRTNVGMYRMQVLDKDTTAMHWQRHKTGASHFEAWKKSGKKMPVSVALGGDPVYAYSATAPLPENVDEYILAGFLRKKKVRLVRCMTNELYVPYDADIILEGYVDPAEDPVWEGPFGDHTGFYSLADWYPKFHVTCITHSEKAIYPATIVGIPPQEDAWLSKATEKIFLSPVKMAIQPEIEDFHLPDAGIAHNLMIVKIHKSYPGQGMKVLNALFGAGQMMFTKYLVVVSGNTDIRNYKELLVNIFANVDFRRDLLFNTGPLDVLDHSSESFSLGGKLGIDATEKLPEETNGNAGKKLFNKSTGFSIISASIDKNTIKNWNPALIKESIPVLIVAVDRTEDQNVLEKVYKLVSNNDQFSVFRLILAVDHTVDVTDLHMVAWQVLGNSDPKRDHKFITPSSVLIDGTIKAYRNGGFPRKWPNIVCSDLETILNIDQKWESLGLGAFIHSPSLRNIKLLRPGRDEIIID